MKGKDNLGIFSEGSVLIGIGYGNLTKEYGDGVPRRLIIAGQLIDNYMDYDRRTIGFYIKIQQQIPTAFEGRHFNRLLKITQSEISLDYIGSEWILTFDTAYRETKIGGFYDKNKEIATLMDKLFEKVNSESKPFEIGIKCDYRGEDKNKDFSWKQSCTPEDLIKYARDLRYFTREGGAGWPEIPKALEFILERWPN